MTALEERLQAAVDELVADRIEVGIQVAVCGRGGEVLANVHGGIADPASGTPVTDATLFRIFSATKGVTSTALHVQVARGLLDYDDLIDAHWPGFGRLGKSNATVRDALTHAVGVPQMPDHVSVEEMCEWDLMVDAVAGLPPLWEPGTHTGYHAYTFGWIVGELVRRTDPRRRPFCGFVRDEVCGPLGIDHLWVGGTPVDAPIARLVDDRTTGPPEGLRRRAIPAHLDTKEAVFGRPDVQRSCHPAAGGVSDALSLARHYAGLLAGDLLASEHLAHAADVARDDEDQVLGHSIRKGLGYWIAGPGQGATAPMGTDRTSFGHPGAGGSIGWADQARGVGVAILRNRMTAPGEGTRGPEELGSIVRDELPATLAR